jgi:ferredoxin
MSVTHVWLDESKNTCIYCGNCGVIAPQVFEVHHKMSVKSGVHFSNYEFLIKEAVLSCPTDVIKFY